MKDLKKRLDEAQSLLRVLVANEECLYSRLGMTESSIEKISSAYGLFQSSAEDNIKYLLKDLKEINSIQESLLKRNGMEL